MTFPYDPTPRPTSHGVPTYVVLGALLAAGLAVTWWLSTLSAPAPATLDPTEMARHETARVDGLAREEAAGRARAAQLRIRDVIQATADALTAAEQELARWETEVLALLENADGQRVAARESDVLAFLRYTACEGEAPDAHACARPTHADLAAHAERLRALAALPLARLEAQDPAYVPAAGTLKDLEAERDWALAARDAYAEPRKQVEMLVASASQEPAALTLGDAIAAYRQGQARAAAAREAERVRAAEATKQAAADAARKRQAEAEAADIARRARLHEDQLRGDFRRDQLQQEALAPDTLALYRPFLGEGTFRYPGTKHAPVLGPMSFTDIRDKGGLRNFQNFLNLASPKNDRGGWPAPRTAAERAEYQDRWERFKRYVPIWVSYGKLRP